MFHALILFFLINDIVLRISAIEQMITANIAKAKLPCLYTIEFTSNAMHKLIIKIHIISIIVPPFLIPVLHESWIWC